MSKFRKKKVKIYQKANKKMTLTIKNNGTTIADFTSLTNIVAVLMIAIANLILLNIQQINKKKAPSSPQIAYPI